VRQEQLDRPELGQVPVLGHEHLGHAPPAERPEKAVGTDLRARDEGGDRRRGLKLHVEILPLAGGQAKRELSVASVGVAAITRRAHPRPGLG